MGVSDCYKGLRLFSPSAVFRDGKYFGTKGNRLCSLQKRYIKNKPDLRFLPMPCKKGTYEEYWRRSQSLACKVAQPELYQIDLSLQNKEYYEKLSDCWVSSTNILMFKGNSPQYPDSADCFPCDSRSSEVGLSDPSKCTGCPPGKKSWLWILLSA